MPSNPLLYPCRTKQNPIHNTPELLQIPQKKKPKEEMNTCGGNRKRLIERAFWRSLAMVNDLRASSKPPQLLQNRLLSTVTINWRRLIDEQVGPGHAYMEWEMDWRGRRRKGFRVLGF